MNVKELCSTKVRNNLNITEPVHMLSEVCIWLQQSHSITVNFSLFRCKVIQFVVIKCVVIMDASESLS